MNNFSTALSSIGIITSQKGPLMSVEAAWYQDAKCIYYHSTYMYVAMSDDLEYYVLYFNYNALSSAIATLIS